MKNRILCFLCLLCLCLLVVPAVPVRASSSNYIIYEGDIAAEIEGMTDEQIFNYLCDFYYDEVDGNCSDYTYIVMGKYSYQDCYAIYFSADPYYAKLDSVYDYYYFVSNKYIRVYMSSDMDSIYIYWGSGSQLVHSESGIIYTNQDIYDADGNLIIEEMSFPKPQLVLGMEQTILTAALAANPLQEIVLLLPIAIAALVGLTAFWKGLKAFSAIFKSA